MKRKYQELVSVSVCDTTNKKDILSKEVIDSTSKVVSHNYKILSPEDIVRTINELFGSVYNILHYAGGSGAYLILGPSEAGKTTLIKSLYYTAQLFAEKYGLVPLVWSTILVFSGSADITNDLEWAKEITVQQPLDEDYIAAAIKARLDEMKEGADDYNTENGTNITPEQWALDNPMAIIVDDWNGIINATRPNNYLASLTTVVRKYGVYVFLLAQGFSQCGPTIKDNIRVTLTLQLNNANTRVLLDRMYGSVYDAQKLSAHNLKRYHVNLFVRQWLLSLPQYGGVPPQVLSLPPFPLYAGRDIMTKEQFLSRLREMQEQNEYYTDEEEEELEDENLGTDGEYASVFDVHLKVEDDS
jgi:hypothetical protein